MTAAPHRRLHLANNPLESRRTNGRDSARGAVIQEWDRVRTDWLTIAAGGSGLPTPAAGMPAIPALPTAPTTPAVPR